jgi:hypothetical protein
MNQAGKYRSCRGFRQNYISFAEGFTGIKLQAAEIMEFNSGSKNLKVMTLHVLGQFAKLRQATISFVVYVCLSVHPSVRNNSAPTRRI